MTSYQQIPLRAASENFSAMQPEPLLPREYFNPQIILNSARLIFNASSDSIIASAKDSIACLLSLPNFIIIPLLFL